MLRILTFHLCVCVCVFVCAGDSANAFVLIVGNIPCVAKENLIHCSNKIHSHHTWHHIGTWTFAKDIATVLYVLLFSIHVTTYAHCAILCQFEF